MSQSALRTICMTDCCLDQLIISVILVRMHIYCRTVVALASIARVRLSTSSFLAMPLRVRPSIYLSAYMSSSAVDGDVTRLGLVSE